MPGEIDIDSIEGDIYTALKEKVPVVKDVVGYGVSIIKLLYGIGETDSLDAAIARLDREQQRLLSMLSQVQ